MLDIMVEKMMVNGERERDSVVRREYFFIFNERVINGEEREI